MGQGRTAVAWRARRWSKPWSSSREPSPRSRRLPATPALRREQIKLQVALANALILTSKAMLQPETKASVENAHSVDRTSRSAGRTARRPAAVVFGPVRLLGANFSHFNGEAVRDLATQFLALAEKQRTTGPAYGWASPYGHSLLFAGDLLEGRAHFDQAIALYDPVEHRPLATRFGQDIGGGNFDISVMGPVGAWLSRRLRSQTSNTALRHAREIGQAATLMYALAIASAINLFVGDCVAANRTFSTNSSLLAEESGATHWRINEQCCRGCLLTLTGNPADAIQMLTTGNIALRSIGSDHVEPSLFALARDALTPNLANPTKLGAVLARL